MRADELSPVRVAYERRNRDLDPQLVWKGKDEQDWSDLVVPAPPLYIQEKIHPKVLIDDLQHRSEANIKAAEAQIDLFASFNGLPSEAAKTEFYQHGAHWANRMILGDSLQVMASLAEREGLKGRVQCIYIDPPYGIKFNSNFQWSTTSRDVKDTAEHITREPKLPLFAKLSDDELLGYGEPSEWLPDVRRTSDEDGLLELADHLPKEAAEALLDLATGKIPQMGTWNCESPPFRSSTGRRRPFKLSIPLNQSRRVSVIGLGQERRKVFSRTKLQSSSVQLRNWIEPERQQNWPRFHLRFSTTRLRPCMEKLRYC
jgi:hypothetical protein